MTLRGYIRDGRVVVDAKVDLPEGTEVNVSLSARSRASKKRAGRSASRKPARSLRRGAPGPTLLERYGAIIGIAGNLPSDLAKQHNHYARGTRKRR